MSEKRHAEAHAGSRGTRAGRDGPRPRPPAALRRAGAVGRRPSAPGRPGGAGRGGRAGPSREPARDARVGQDACRGRRAWTAAVLARVPRSVARPCGRARARGGAAGRSTRSPRPPGKSSWRRSGAAAAVREPRWRSPAPAGAVRPRTPPPRAAVPVDRRAPAAALPLPPSRRGAAAGRAGLAGAWRARPDTMKGRPLAGPPLGSPRRGYRDANRVRSWRRPRCRRSPSSRPAPSW